MVFCLPPCFAYLFCQSHKHLETFLRKLRRPNCFCHSQRKVMVPPVAPPGGTHPLLHASAPSPLQATNSSSESRPGEPYCSFRRRHFLGSSGPRCARGSEPETPPRFPLNCDTRIATVCSTMYSWMRSGLNHLLLDWRHREMRVSAPGLLPEIGTLAQSAPRRCVCHDLRHGIVDNMLLDALVGNDLDHLHAPFHLHCCVDRGSRARCGEQQVPRPRAPTVAHGASETSHAPTLCGRSSVTGRPFGSVV